MEQLSDQLATSGTTALASTLVDRLSEFAAGVTDRIWSQVDAYHEGLVPRKDLEQSCRENLEFGFRRLSDADSYDLSAPRRTGRRRAEQGAPLAMVLSAYRIGFSYMWECVVSEAERSGLVSATELVQIASHVWTLCETFTTAMATAYRDALTEQILRRDQERSALVEALMQGKVADTSTLWEAADLLDLPYQGKFVVVVAEPQILARQALPNIEGKLRAGAISSAWRLLPDLHVGVVSVRSPKVITETLARLRSVALARVGVSPVYTGLEKTPQAMHLARIALASVAPGDTRVCIFDDAPVPAMIASSPTTSYRVMKNILGPVLDCAEQERKVLLDTLKAYFDGGSAASAAKRLYCHRNTVRHRLIRIEQLTGRSIDDPVSAVELYIAIQTLCRLPKPPE